MKYTLWSAKTEIPQLRSGMVVEYASGNCYLIIKNGLMLQALSLTSYSYYNLDQLKEVPISHIWSTLTLWIKDNLELE